VTKAAKLTALQVRLLEVLWERREATATEVHAALERDLDLARVTIGTLLHRLERQGVVTHTAEGREYKYRALVSREALRRARVDAAVAAFQGDVAGLVNFAVSRADVRPDEINQLRAMLAAHAAKTKR
jgi:BlaI family penicillinase repressor